MKKKLKQLSTKRRLLFRLKTRLNGNVFKVNSERKSEKQRLKQYKENIEFGFQTGNMRNAWKGLKTLAGHYKSKLNTSNKPGD